MYTVLAVVVVTDELEAAKVGASNLTCVYNAAVPEADVLLSVIVDVSRCIIAPSPGVTFLSPSKVKPVNVPNDVIPDCAASTDMTELDAVNPVPANNVARSAIASFLVALLSFASENMNESPSATAPAANSLTPPTTAAPATLTDLPEVKLIPESSISNMSVPSTLNTYLPLSELLEAAAVSNVTLSNV